MSNCIYNKIDVFIINYTFPTIHKKGREKKKFKNYEKNHKLIIIRVNNVNNDFFVAEELLRIWLYSKRV